MINEEYFRSKGITANTKHQLKQFLLTKYSLTEDDWDTILEYFHRREPEAQEEESFGIVFAVTRYCNLNCVHCAVSAPLVKEQKISPELSTSQVFTILDKIQKYINKTGFKLCLDFGGGEPTLRPDIEEILAYASTKLGAEHLSLSSNGTCSIEEMIRLGEYVGTIEISLDGLENEHNRMRDPKKITDIENPFKTTSTLISQMLKEDSLRKKVQVTSVSLRWNSPSLLSVARWLKEEGLTNYYIIRRPMPVGRMASLQQDILSAAEFLYLFLQMAKFKKENPTFKLRMHHSLESIYSALFLGKDIYDTQLPMGSGKHSIGIDWNGFVYFDPWSLMPPFNSLRAGNLLRTDLEELMDDPHSILKLGGEIVKKNVRCRQCKMPCTGGMRFNAISHYIHQLRTERPLLTHLIAGFSEIDPACLLYEE